MRRVFLKPNIDGATVVSSNPFKTPLQGPVGALEFNYGCPIFFLDRGNSCDMGVTHCDEIPFFEWFIVW